MPTLTQAVQTESTKGNCIAIPSTTHGLFGWSPRKRLAIAFWALAIILGAAQAWIVRNDIVNDTVSYLDMGDAFFSGHPAAIINGIWSPLYAVLLGLTIHLFRPGIRLEYPAVHLLLFFIFLFTLACFEFFLRQLEIFRVRVLSETSEAGTSSAWIAIAYAVFLWASLDLIGVHETNPDMLVAAFFFLGCGLLTRIAAGYPAWQEYFYLGLALGLSYLTKAVMLPVAVAMLGSAWFVAPRSRKYLPVAAATLVLVAAPYVGGLSAQKGRFTIGETGRFNYAMHIDHIAYHHWQGGDPSFGVPAHPTREISSAPAAFEFNGPIAGTYPAWYDPSYWYEGVKIKLDLKRELKAIKSNLRTEVGAVFFAVNGTLFASLFIAFGRSTNKAQVLKNAGRLGFLIVPAAFASALYALVHYEPRYVGGFFAMLAVCVFASILWAENLPDHRLFASMALLQVICLVLFVAPHHNANSGYEAGTSYQEVAQGAEVLGLQPGDRIASLNFSNLGTAMWARLARVQIVAEVYAWPGENDNSFWRAAQADQEELLRRFQQAGARAVVTSDTPAGPGADQWSRIGNTGYYLHWLIPQTVLLHGAPNGGAQSQ